MMHSNVTKIVDKFVKIQVNFVSGLHGYSDTLNSQEIQIKIGLEKVLHIEEIFLQQKFKVKWYFDDYRNITFFS